MLSGALQRERCGLRAVLQVRMLSKGQAPVLTGSPRRAQGFSLRLVGEEKASLTQSVPSRSRTCCRHFLLAQLGDGRHVVLGEDSSHVQLQDLLQHYTEYPLGPYREMLTQPLARQVSPYPKPITEAGVILANTFSVHTRSRPLASSFLIPTHDWLHLPTPTSPQKGVLSRPDQSQTTR